MRSFLLTTTYSLLTASGLVTLARWFHPATFSQLVLTALLIGFTASGLLYLWRYE